MHAFKGHNKDYIGSSEIQQQDTGSTFKICNMYLQIHISLFSLKTYLKILTYISNRFYNNFGRFILFFLIRQYKYYTHTLNKTHLMVSKKKSAKTKSFGNGFFGWFFPPLLLGPHTHTVQTIAKGESHVS